MIKLRRVMTTLVAAGIVCFGMTALAQPGASPPSPSSCDPVLHGPTACGPDHTVRSRPLPPPNRQYYGPRLRPRPARSGFVIGFGAGVGGMDSGNDLFRCAGCDKNDGLGGIGIDFHVGGMLNPQLAVLFELWGTGGQLDSDASLIQSMAMVAGQYWITPKLWLKGGVGVAQLTLSDRNFDDEELDSGLGIMGAAGYEVLSSGNFTMDVQLRVGAGFYEDLGPDGDEISAGTLGLGFNWY